MGTTLYNKIHLGRSQRRMQAALAFSMLAGAAIAWATLRALK